MSRKHKPSALNQSAETEREIERLGRLTPEALTHEDLRILKRIRDCRASLQECENELSELKETKKARKEALEEALRGADRHYDCRQLALNFSGNLVVA
jgi:hypothetical protein